MRQTFRLLLWAIAGLLVIASLCAALLLWRLAAGPMQVAFLRPYLEEVVSASVRGHRADIQETVLVWDRAARNVDVLARNVRVLDAGGAAVANFPAVAVTLSLSALLHRTVAVTEVQVKGVQVKVTRLADGRFALGTGVRQRTVQAAGEGRAGNVPQLLQRLPGLLADLMSKPDPLRPLAYLREVGITNGALTVYDEALGVVWPPVKANLSIRRGEGGLVALAHVGAATNGSASQVEAEISYRASSSALDLVVALSRINPATMPPFASTLQVLSGIDLPLSGKVSAALDLQGRLQKLRFRIAGEAGHLSHPQWLPTPLPIAEVTALGGLDPDNHTLHLEDATIRFASDTPEAAVIALGGRLLPDAHAMGVQGSIVLRHVPMATLKKHTPPHLRDRLPQALSDLLALGSIEQASSQFELSLPTEDRNAVRVKTLAGTLHSHVPLQHSVARVDASWDYKAAGQKGVIDVSVADLRLPGLAPLLPSLGVLAGIDVPVDGDLGLALTPHGRLQTVDFHVHAGAGTLSLPGALPAPMAVASMDMRGRWDGLRETLVVDELVSVLGDGKGQSPVVRSDFEAQRSGQQTLVTGHVELRRFPIADLDQYWPRGVSEKTRRWLTTNIVEGVVERVGLDFKLSGATDDVGAFKVDHVAGTMQFRDVDVHYLRPLPPITAIDGTARFNRQGFEIEIVTGKGPGLHLTEGEVRISGLDRDRDAIAIRLGIEAPVRDVLTLLDAPALDLIAGFGIDPSQTGGQAAVQAAFDFSLRGNIHIDKVDIKVHGTMQDVVVRKLFMGHDAVGGDLHLNLDNQGMQVRGTTRFAGLPLRVNWREAFIKQAEWRTEIEVVAPRIGQADLLRLGVDLPAPVGGSFAAELTARLSRRGKHVVQTELDVQKAELSLPMLGWHKTTGESGSIRGTLQLDRRQGLADGTLAIQVGTLSARGTGQIETSQGTLTRLDLEDLNIARTRLRDIKLRRQHDNIDIVIGAGVVDAQALVHSRGGAQSRHQESSVGGGETATQRNRVAARMTPWRLRAPALQRVYFATERYLEAVSVELRHGADGWALIDLSGHIPDAFAPSMEREDQAGGENASRPASRQFGLAYRTAWQRGSSLTAQTNDLGALLRALNLHDGITGGSLAMEGHGVASAPDKSLKVSLEVRDFVAKKMPLVARILAAASFGGLLDSLNNDGLKFSRLFGDLTLREKRISIELLRAHGGAIGLTGTGEVDLLSDLLDVKGTLVPARVFNTLPGKIPLLGKLIVGGEGQGLVAINYRLQGKLTEPEASVNPASVLTPGILRKLFGLFEGSADVEP